MIAKNLPIDKTYVIQGGPGTGKTLLALLRAKKVLELGTSDYGEIRPRVLYIVFSRPLARSLKERMQESGLTGFTVSAYHSWLWKLFKSRGVDKGYPTIRPFVPDWVKVKGYLIDWHRNSDFGYDHIILDETQHLPLELIDILHSISTDMTIFIDGTVRIDEKVVTTVHDVVSLVCESSRCVFWLTDRNHNYPEGA